MALANNKQRKRSNVLVLVEACIISYVAYLANAIVAFTTATLPADSFTLIVSISILTFSILVFSLSVGLYEVKLRETFRGIIRRIFVSVALSYFVVELLSSLFFSDVRPHPYYLPVASGSIILSLVVFRYFISKLGILGLGGARIIVIGAGERASIIEKRMRRDVDRLGFELLGFVPIP